MITLYDFHAMTLPEKAATVWEGTFIGDRPEGELFVQLYNMGTFYAEVFYNREINEIVKVRGFKSTKLIEPYLKAIKITF
ncbi:hypothetical protein [Mucilaginibacter aquariorum]|uniref:Uncharacterized protein n=1 Tax=Mucilaginibacter aquariorum TaxID=2967225 RepID=A0ABT1SY25_9SPHI|nr:hypothetical protein [Mucilaginibacter aquariorum]MCQ6957244.1 hypothetical protein [Mucilaginibacter aquariorum]